MSQKGFAPLVLIIIIGLALLGGAGVHYVQNKVSHIINISNSNSNVSSKKTSSNQQEVNQIISKMKANSQEWFKNADNPEKRKTLHAANVALAQQLQKLLPNSKITYNEHTGCWYKDGVGLYKISRVGKVSFSSQPTGAKVYIYR